MEAVADRKKRVARIIAKLKPQYPDSRCLLDYATPLDLLVATILAAQCTDERVNRTTPEVFRRYKTPADYATAPQEELETLIRSCGTFRRKAAAVRLACEAIIERHGGQVPADLDALSSLPGVGRKTANVVMGNAFGVPSVIVDTHMIRVSGRLGLASPHNVAKKYADKIEQELLEAVPAAERTTFSHLIAFHGRRICFARKPNCPECAIQPLCPFPEKTQA